MKKEDFLREANIVHNNKYRYEITENNIRLKDYIKAFCSIHGEFRTIAYEHIRKGRGCPKCSAIERGNKQRGHLSDFIDKSKKIHGNKYDYSKVNYINNSTKVCIICPEHGEFWQTPNSHLNGRGCPKCGKLNTANKLSLTKDEFVRKAVEKFGNKYDYKDVIYINKYTPIDIICPIHGKITITPQNHLRGCGCPKCRYVNMGLSQMLTTSDFIDKSKKIHGNKYDYSLTEYKGYEIPVKIICPIHGEFWQTPDSHLHSGGCPMCGNIVSKGEDELFNIIVDKLGKEKVISRSRDIIDGYELDIYMPSKKIAIEYNGILWHSEKYGKGKLYHLNKTIKCQEKGIKLIQVFEDEYLNHRDIVLAKILHIINVDNEKIHIGGRKCIVSEISNDISKEFLNKNHIQGYSRASVNIGAFYNGVLIGVMQFKNSIPNEGKWELTRFATDNNIICQGIGGKLFKFFTRNYDPNEIKTFADVRWTFDKNNNLYTKIGFELDSVKEPTYSYYCQKYYGMRRVHKFNFRKQILHKKYGFPLTMTEDEMAKELKAYKVWDCGLYKYIWKKY